MKKLTLVVLFLLALTSIGIAAVDIQGYGQKGDEVYINIHASRENWYDEPINIKCVFTFFPSSDSRGYGPNVEECWRTETLSRGAADTVYITIPSPGGFPYKKNNCKVQIWYSDWTNILRWVGEFYLD